MAARQITASQTLEEFRTQFNALSATDFGDIATLDSNISATSVIGAVNELYASIAGSLSFTISDGSNTQAVGNAQTLTFAGAANQIVPTVSATDTVTYALRDDVTIAGEFTASGTGTHTLGTITFGSNTILSTNSDTITINDNVTAAGTIQAGSTQINPSAANTNITNTTGTLRIGSHLNLNAGKTLIFEGATDDAHETTIQVTDPTADRTITIPNETGTIVTTGSSAVVTGTMIGLDTVAEANMADDAIGQDQLKSVVTLQIIDSGGTVVKTMFAAGA
tara:strand:- start:283 stop:1119 length:837 start_codon:yes stop_codon:yes gene_type:complete